MASEEINHALIRLREDYARVDGKSFDYFCCPLTWRDEPRELCMGHIIPESLPNCSRITVVQRKDIDNFYGRAVEADFATLLKGGQPELKGGHEHLNIG